MRSAPISPAYVTCQQQQVAWHACTHPPAQHRLLTASLASCCCQCRHHCCSRPAGCLSSPPYLPGQVCGRCQGGEQEVLHQRDESGIEQEEGQWVGDDSGADVGPPAGTAEAVLAAGPTRQASQRQGHMVVPAGNRLLAGQFESFQRHVWGQVTDPQTCVEQPPTAGQQPTDSPLRSSGSLPCARSCKSDEGSTPCPVPP